MGVATGKSTSPKHSASIANEESIIPKNLTVDREPDQTLLVHDQPPGSDYLPYLARATNDAVRDWDVKSGKLCWPVGLRSLFGYEPASEQRLDFWDERVHPSDRTKISSSLSQALASNAEQWSGEYRFRCAEGNYLHILERAFIVRDREGQARRFIGSLMDITARKQLHDQLLRSQKMEAFGQLAGGVAHDFNNFLTTILGYSDLVLHETDSKSGIARHINEIRKAAGRASALAGQLLAFSRRQALEPHVVEVNSIITNLERTLLRLLGENITVVCHLHQEKSGAHIKVDAGQLTQIVVNLALNARDAMPAGGQLTLETDVVTLSRDEVASGAPALPVGEYVVISVIDNGDGMTEETKAHLFEPFFTTKSAERSSGLGLATSYGIVCQSGGNMRVESELRKGTRVEIYLPKVPAPPPPSYRKPSSRLLPTGTETIMVVEDDVGVRHISIRVLRNLGYEVIEAASCTDAQRLFNERGDRKIHLLLIDMVLPHMSGRDFAEWLRKASPETKIVFVSGYLEESINPRDRIEPDTFFLSKPFDPEQLAQAIRQALDS
ncbi:MAG TPA: ATP-binding protein [Chthoniobacterales bacterium]|nr:ATP-binding protein [Chthoniobacterales bacterium]